MSKDRLLSDEEWKEHLQGLIMDAAIDYSNNGHRNFYEDAEIALNLINTQKRLYAESVEEELLDMAYDTIISYGYMRDDGKYMSGGFSTQELAFSHMRKIGAIDNKGLFDPQAYMKYCNELRAEQRARIK